MTEALFTETARYEEQLREQAKRRLNVSGVLGILGVSRSGYYSWRKRLPSDREKRRNTLKEKILAIYHESHQNYGAPKITECLRKEGERISEKTVGNYMRELGIKAQYIKPYTVTTVEAKTLFAGIVTDFSFSTINDQKKLTLELATGSILMDEKKHFRSFQDPSATYEQIFKKIMTGYTGSNVSFSKPYQETEGALILQYSETDWDFLKRLASRNNEFLVPDSRTKGVRIG